MALVFAAVGLCLALNANEDGSVAATVLVPRPPVSVERSDYREDGPAACAAAAVLVPYAVLDGTPSLEQIRTMLRICPKALLVAGRPAHT